MANELTPVQTGTIAAIPKNPTYPKRNHTTEGPQWAAVLEEWETKIAALLKAVPAGKSLGELGEKGRVLSQMVGARDQIRDAAKRLPREVSHMYHEDHDRLDQAVAALGRLFAKYGKL